MMAGGEPAERALVLGGGGVAGIAWEAGMLAGLRTAGVDLSDADLIVGTSAGSVVGSFLAHDGDLAAAVQAMAEQAADRAAGRAGGPPAPPADMTAVMTAFAILFDPEIEPQEARARVGRLALETPVDGRADRLRAIADWLPDHGWPDRRLLVTAVDTADGGFTVWHADAGVPLPLAVMSSCAVPCVFPPVEIGGSRYMDGGVRSMTNADLARGASAVVVLEPMAHLAPRDRAEAELKEIGTDNIASVVPDQAAVDAFGLNVLDDALWGPAFEAGLAQASSAAGQVAAVWGR